MSKNVKYKRDAISIMRDGIKAQYKRGSSCEICGVGEDIELHHYHTVSLLVKNFAKQYQLDFSDQDVVLDNRDKFYQQHWHELVEDTVSLCVHHHQLLHKVYSKEPPLFSANKQKTWVEKQHNKIMNPSREYNSPEEDSSGLGKFIDKTVESGFSRFLL